MIREGKCNVPFQHLVPPSSIKKHLSAGLKKRRYMIERSFEGQTLKNRLFAVNVLRFNVSFLQSQTFLFNMYRNINTDLVVNYFFVCVIFKVIWRSIKGQIIEKWAFSEYKYHFFLSISLRIICILLFFGIVLLVLIL